jgi:hypothetical protein
MKLRTDFCLRPTLLVMMVIAVALLSGCSSTMNAIKNKDLAVEAKMSDTIFLEAETLSDAMQGAPGAVFVRVANTSDFQEIDFAEVMRARLTDMGYKVTRNPKEASYTVAANLLYRGEKKEGMDGDAILRAGFGGAVLGAGIAAVGGSDLRGAGAAGLIAGGEALIGGVFHVDEYLI